MKILFVHANFPGQYRYLAVRLAQDPANTVVAIMDEKNDVAGRDQFGIQVHKYKLAKVLAKAIHPYLTEFDDGVRRGQQVARICNGLRQKGFVPDVICVHPGWGSALYLREVYPESRILTYCESYNPARKPDFDFDPEYPGNLDTLLHGRTWNAINLLGLDSCDWGLSPTRWQWGLHPAAYQPKISVIFDGIDTHRIRPDPEARMVLGGGKLSLTRADEVITFVSRGLEPLRGWHSFIRSVPAILERHPKAQVLIVGGDAPAYSQAPPGTTFKQKHLAEVRNALDMTRIHFLGKIPYDRFVEILQISSAHVYLTYPAVLSWSMIEAMAAGCLVIGSRTAPVEEIIEHRRNGLLVDFFSPAAIADAVDEVLGHHDRMQGIRDQARQTAIDRYDVTSICLPRQIELIRSLAAGRLPKPSVGDSPRFDHE